MTEVPGGSPPGTVAPGANPARAGRRMTLFDVEELTGAPVPPLVRVRATVSYDGTAFHGFAPNVGVATVGGTLAEAFERYLRHPVELTCAGRTDRGVHAHGQVVDLATTAGVDLEGLGRAVNALCGPAIAVRGLELVPLEWSARFDATARRYRYTIWNEPVPDPFLRHTAWHVPQPMNVDLLTLACDPLMGEHDFSSFCRRPKRADGTEASLVRRVVDARWEQADDGTLRFWIEAGSFCHQMVRSIVGTLVDVGLRKRTAAEVRSILTARDRAAAGPVAPPQGLSLWLVRYAGACDEGAGLQPEDPPA